MKLSEAIREGAKLRPQTSWEFLCKDGSCAMGAAYEATFEYQLPFRITKMLDIYPILGQKVINPVTYAKTDLYTAIVWLNFLPWSREAIAEWVATIEDQLEQQAEPQVKEELNDPTPALT